MIEVARVVHNDIDALSSEDSLAAASSLICAFIEKVDFGRDLERALEMLMSMRQAFSNIDSAKTALAERAIVFADRALAIVSGRHTAKTTTFARTVFTFVAVIVPAVDDPLVRLRLATVAGGAALRHSCISHADAFLRGAVQEIPELPSARAAAAAAGGITAGGAAGLALDASVCAQVARFVETAIAMPGHPELGPFYLVKGLLMALMRYPWSPSPAASAMRTLTSLSSLQLLHALGMSPLPVRIPNVDSNDVLYAGDPTYGEELVMLHRSSLETIVAQLSEAAAGSHKDVILDAAPEVLDTALLGEMLKTDLKGSVPLIEKICLLLKGSAPDHPVLARSIAQVSNAIKKHKEKA